MLALALALLPGAVQGQLASSDHLLLQVRSCSSTRVRAAGSAPRTFEPADGGEGRVCRGADATDRGRQGVDYELILGTASLEECKAQCLSTRGCKGIEYKDGNCEVWVRPGGIETTAPSPGYICLRLRGGPQAATFHPADGGAGRACRGADEGDVGVAGTDFTFHGAESLEQCKEQCVSTPGCQGIEYKENHCEVWTSTVGATANRPGFTCLRYGDAAAEPDGEAFEFVPADQGMGRACRGDGPGDRGTANEDYLVQSAESLSECQALCVAMGYPACQGVEYSANRCELWQRSIGATAPASAYTCLRYAARPEACAGFAAPLVDTDLTGTILAEVFAVSAEQCCSDCKANSACEGFAFSAQWQRCYLKAQVEGTFANVGIVTRLRSGIATTPEPTTGAPPARCEGFGEPMEGMDLTGDLLEEVAAASAAHCCEACGAASACQGFAFVEQGQRCYLKANVTGSYANAGRIAQLKVLPTTSQPALTPGSCDGFLSEMPDTDLSGLLLAEVVVPSADYCCQACEGIDGCEGYSFLPERTTCYLKGMLTGTYANVGTVVRLKRRRASDFQGLPSCSDYGEALADTDIAGELLGTAPARSAADCCGACAATARCDAFVHLAATQSCYLKAAVTGIYPRPGRVARLQRRLHLPAPTPAPAGACPDFGPVLRDTDVSGDLLEEVTSTSRDGCCGACAARPNCQGFAFLQGLEVCFLKASVTGTYHQTGVISQLHSRASPGELDCSAYGELHEDTDLAGALIGISPAAAPNGCCAACTRTPGCQGFAYVDEFKQCYLKAHLTGIFSKSDVVARYLSHIGS